MPLPPKKLEAASLALGLALRARRSMLGLTLAQVARGAGLTEAHLSDCERGRRMPSVPALLAIADALDVLLVDLLQEVYPFGAARRPRRLGPPPDGRSA